MSATKDRKRRTLKGEQLEKFNKRLEEATPPAQTSNKSVEIIFFLQKASSIIRPAFMGYGGLDRSEIKLSFENFKADFFDLEDFEDIGWAIEFLDESLKKYINSKKEG